MPDVGHHYQAPSGDDSVAAVEKAGLAKGGRASAPPLALPPEIAQRLETQAATLGIHDLSPLLHQTPASLLLLFHARLASLRSLSTLKAALAGLEQRKPLVVAAQTPVAARLEQLLLLALRQLLLRHPSAWSSFRQPAGLLQSSSGEGNAWDQKYSSPAVGERHQDHQQ